VLLEDLIKHLYFRHIIHGLFERFKNLYDSTRTYDIKFQAHSTYIVIKYEKALAYYNQSLDSKIYNELDEKLSKEWDAMKVRYGISDISNPT
jgi:uncharacterized protein YvpB